jgi:hypothetical protein
MVMNLGLMLVTVLLCTGAVACTSEGEPRSPSETGARSAPMYDFPVGATGAFAIYAHCGVEFVQIDGDTWRTRLRDDGNGNAPAWPQEAFHGTLTRPSANVAVYTSPAMPLKNLVFHPAPDARYICM